MSFRSVVAVAAILGLAAVMSGVGWTQNDDYDDYDDEAYNQRYVCPTTNIDGWNVRTDQSYRESPACTPLMGHEMTSGGLSVRTAYYLYSGLLSKSYLFEMSVRSEKTFDRSVLSIGGLSVNFEPRLPQSQTDQNYLEAQQMEFFREKLLQGQDMRLEIFYSDGSRKEYVIAEGKDFASAYAVQEAFITGSRPQ